MASRVNQKAHEKCSSYSQGGEGGERHKPIVSDAPDPLSILPDRSEGGEIAGVKDVSDGGAEPTVLQVIPGIAGANRHELQDARVSIAINHATGAAVANEFRGVELVDIAHRRFPEMAAVKIKVPVEIKIFVTAQT